MIKRTAAGDKLTAMIVSVCHCIELETQTHSSQSRAGFLPTLSGVSDKSPMKRNDRDTTGALLSLFIKQSNEGRSLEVQECIRSPEHLNICTMYTVPIFSSSTNFFPDIYIPLDLCILVLMFPSTYISQYPCSLVPLYQCSSVLMFISTYDQPFFTCF